MPEATRLKTQDTVNKQGSAEEQVEEATRIQGLMKEDQDGAFSNYHSYIEGGLAREIARLNLPLSTYTQWYWKIDLHNLFHFLGLRMHPHAQWEMQKFAEAIFELIKPIVPMSCEAFEDYRINARYFSAQEMNLIRNLINSVPSENETLITMSGLSKHEIGEFKKKLQ